jgi:hypothetical protein
VSQAASGKRERNMIAVLSINKSLNIQLKDIVLPGRR